MRAPLTGSLRKDGRWQIVVTLTDAKGAKVRHTICKPTQREVQAAARELLGANPQRSAPVKHTVSDLFDHCERGPWVKHAARTKEQYAWARKRIEEKFGAMPVIKLTTPLIYRWVEDLTSDPKLSGRSVQIHRNVLRVAMEHARMIGWTRDNPAMGWRAPISSKPAPTPRLEAPTIEEAVSGEPNRRYRLFLQLLWESGARPNEVSAMASSMLERRQTGWWVHVPGTKTDNAPRFVPLTDALVNELMELPEPWFGYDRRQWTRIWARAQIRLGMREPRMRGKSSAPDKKLPTLYQIRKARITAWGDLGLTDEVWAALAGHEDADITRKIYDKPSIQRIAKQLGLREVDI